MSSLITVQIPLAPAVPGGEAGTLRLPFPSHRSTSPPWDLAVPVPLSPSPAASPERLGRRLCHDAPKQSQARGAAARLVCQKISRKVLKTQPGGAGGWRGQEGDRVPGKAFQEHRIPGMHMVPAPPGTACSRGPAAVMLGPVPGSAAGASAKGSVPATPGSWVPDWARQLL